MRTNHIQPPPHTHTRTTRPPTHTLTPQVHPHPHAVSVHLCAVRHVPPLPAGAARGAARHGGVHSNGGRALAWRVFASRPLPTVGCDSFWGRCAQGGKHVFVLAFSNSCVLCDPFRAASLAVRRACAPAARARSRAPRPATPAATPLRAAPLCRRSCHRCTTTHSSTGEPRARAILCNKILCIVDSITPVCVRALHTPGNGAPGWRAPAALAPPKRARLAGQRPRRPALRRRGRAPCLTQARLAHGRRGRGCAAVQRHQRRVDKRVPTVQVWCKGRPRLQCSALLQAGTNRLVHGCGLSAGQQTARRARLPPRSAAKPAPPRSSSLSLDARARRRDWSARARGSPESTWGGCDPRAALAGWGQYLTLGLPAAAMIWWVERGRRRLGSPPAFGHLRSCAAAGTLLCAPAPERARGALRVAGCWGPVRWAAAQASSGWGRTTS